MFFDSFFHFLQILGLRIWRHPNLDERLILKKNKPPTKKLHHHPKLHVWCCSMWLLHALLIFYMYFHILISIYKKYRIYNYIQTKKTLYICPFQTTIHKFPLQTNFVRALQVV